MQRSWYVPAALVTAVAAALVGLPGGAFAAAAAPVNIIKNPGAEAGPGSPDGSKVAVPDWTVKKSNNFTAVQYGAPGGFPAKTDPGPKTRGANFFAGGPAGTHGTATQSDSLAPYKSIIASGASFTLQGWLGGFGSQGDHATLTVTWEDSTGATLGTAVIGPVGAKARKDLTGLLHRELTGTVPAGSATALVTIAMTRQAGAYNDGYADNLSLTIVAAG
ncbi:MAG TPA: hypothetical protein VHY58_18680 [Streptosporangiaceae bacterium]|jgi:hypothetical protein|nr:hypothetical protein [Streptosporangiaceae bacterium]